MMKKKKIAKEFYFKDMEKDEIISIVNSEAPINMKFLEPLVDRIHKRYPIIDKTQTSVIVKAALESLRELLILGNVINFNKFAFDMKLHFFTHHYRKLHAALKVKLSTPPNVKKDLNDRRED